MEIVLDRKKVLGRGGQGDVFEGVWGKTQKPVAVKRVSLLDLDSTCKQEEEALRTLNHINVVKLFHAESDMDFRYYALELCQASLDKLFLDDGNDNKYRGPKLPVWDMLSQLANGLKYIHEVKLVHRDLKPENVLIWVSPTENASSGKTNEVLMKWADFGLSKQTSASGSFSVSGIRGTDVWFAPEILERKDDKTTERRGTNKSDVFAEGLTFGYILLEGKHLYGLSTEIVYNLTKKNPVNLKTIADKPEHGKELHEMLCDMLKPNPLERLTAEEVFIRLQQIFKTRIITVS